MLNRLVPPRPMTASNARITRTSPGALCIPSSSPSAFPVPDKVRSLRGKVTHRGEPCETYRGAQFPCWAGRMRTDLSVVTRRLSSLDPCRIHPLEVDSARLRPAKFLRIECKHSRSQRCCILDDDAKAPPGSAGRGVSRNLRSSSPSRASGGEKPAQCASGSGRTWKCTAMGFMPLPPSWSQGVRSPLEVHRPRPFQPALGSSMRPSRPLA